MPSARRLRSVRTILTIGIIARPAPRLSLRRGLRCRREGMDHRGAERDGRLDGRWEKLARIASRPAMHEAPDADRDWNALSLPFVVGPHGRIGKLNAKALDAARVGK